MKAFILAAGAGTRLRPLTHSLPKPMIPLVNKPVIEHTVDNLKKHNITSIKMNLHFMPHVIKNYFKNGNEYGIDISYSEEKKLLGTAGGLKKCETFFDKTFVVMSGDGLSDIDLTSAVKFHKKKKSLATMVLKKIETKFSYGITLTDKSGKIIKFVEKPSWGDVFANTANTGIYIFEPEIFKYIPKGFYDFGMHLWPKLLKLKKPIFAYTTADYWTDIGNIEEYRNGTKDAVEGKVKIIINGNKKYKNVIIGNNSAIDKSVKFIGKAVIGKNSKIGKNVIIEGPAVIGDNVIIQDNAIIKKSIIWNNSRIGKNVKLDSSIIGSNITDKLSVYNGLLLS